MTKPTAVLYRDRPFLYRDPVGNLGFTLPSAYPLGFAFAVPPHKVSYQFSPPICLRMGDVLVDGLVAYAES